MVSQPNGLNIEVPIATTAQLRMVTGREGYDSDFHELSGEAAYPTPIRIIARGPLLRMGCGRRTR